ncbi:hypothetical protein LP420_29835 [Massilia sp. B-10]|nr:hypothetical protein LP420_29835 [Massilia sp. B-10]
MYAVVRAIPIGLIVHHKFEVSRLIPAAAHQRPDGGQKIHCGGHSLLHPSILLLVIAFCVLFASLAPIAAYAGNAGSVPLSCGGGGGINVPDTSGPKALTIADISSLAGEYCDNAGSYEADGATTDGLSCNVSLSSGGTYSIQVGGNGLPVLQHAAMQ